MHSNKILWIFLFSLFGLSMSAQKTDITIAEDSLSVLFQSLFEFDGIRYVRSDEEKAILNQKITALFEQILQDKKSFSFPFSKLQKVSILSSKRVRIYTWDTQMKDHSHIYHGFIQYHPKKNKLQVYTLHDYSESIPHPLFLKLKPETWYGCLYYQMIPKKYRGKYYYTLIGWDGNNLLTSKKIIDVLTFTRTGKPRFGKKIFMIKQRPKPARIIYEFSAKTTMVIHYDTQRDTLYMDHLSPSKPFYKGLYQFYGPDFSYDGLHFEKGKWYLSEDIKPRNAKFRQSEPAKTKHPLIYKSR